jgi:hypothetical protein
MCVKKCEIAILSIYLLMYHDTALCLSVKKYAFSDSVSKVYKKTALDSLISKELEKLYPRRTSSALKKRAMRQHLFPRESILFITEPRSDVTN